MRRPWDPWRCPVCDRTMTTEAAAEGFCAEARRAPLCLLPLDLATLRDEEDADGD